MFLLKDRLIPKETRRCFRLRCFAIGLLPALRKLEINAGLVAERLELLREQIAHPVDGFQSPQESSAEASRHTPALLSPNKTTMTSRPGRAPLAIKQWPAASV
jgi:hypothetical protein